MRVLIAGAGPVGLTAAVALARRGHEVKVLEAGETLAAESRASTYHPPTLEMLADLGALDALMARGLTSHTFQYRERRGGVVAELDLRLLSDDTPYPYRVQCEQSKLTPILLEMLRELGGEVVFGSPVTEAAQDGEGVTAATADGSVHTGDWLLGADGAHSAVRRSLDVPFEGMTYPERFLVASTEEDLQALLPGIAAVNYVFDPEEWLVLLRTPDHWRVLFPTPEGTPDEDELARLPERLRGVADVEWKVAHSTLYRVHQRVASRFRTGRVVLVGDAAHVNNPLGGMGLNSGIHDAVAVAAALGDDEALDRACEHRRHVAESYVQKITHSNWEQLRDPERHKDGLRALAADPVQARAHLLRTSMIASLRPVGSAE